MTTTSRGPCGDTLYKNPLTGEMVVERAIQIDFVKSIPCMKCHREKLMAGPDHNRWAIWCAHCGHRFTAKPVTIERMLKNLARLPKP